MDSYICCPFSFQIPQILKKFFSSYWSIHKVIHHYQIDTAKSNKPQQIPGPLIAHLENIFSNSFLPQLYYSHERECHVNRFCDNPTLSDP